MFLLDTIFGNIDDFSDIYYRFTFLIFAPLFLCSLIDRHQPYLSKLLFILLSIVFLYGSYRFSGSDWGNYLIAYNHPFGGFIIEPGFNFILLLLKGLGISFPGTLLCFALVSLYALYTQSKHFCISIGILSFLYFIHFYIVRDLVQVRIGLGISLFLLGVCSKGKSRVSLIFFSLTMHYTLLFLLITYLFSEALSVGSKVKKVLLLTIAVSTTFTTTYLLDYLSVIDPRIDLYLNWDASGYGYAAESMNQLIFAIFVTIIALRNRTLYNDFPFIVWTPVLAILTFIAFKDYAIFAYRLTNISLSFYPIIIGLAITKSSRTLERLGLAIITLLIVFNRSGSSDILARITVLGLN